jgi:hypothetical protein
MKAKFVDEQNCSLLKNIRDDLFSSQASSDYVAYACDRQLVRSGKRLLTSNPVLEKKAIDLFLQMNDLASTTDVPCVDPLIIGEARDFIVTKLEQFTARYYEGIQHDLDLRLLFALWKFGPGASNGVEGSHFCDKIIQPMTSTKRCFPYTVLLRQLTPRLHLQDLVNEFCGVTLCKGSRLSTVPKNADIARVIAIEPSGNMALQLAAGMYIEGALRCSGLDISTQEVKNKNLAQFGSFSGELATIDLKSASDLITPALIKALFPSDWYNLLMALRSETITLPENRGDVELHMMSTMGNGFTFPVMTFVLLALCYAVNRVKANGRRFYLDYLSWGVYGDDIICPVYLFNDICEVLTGCGLIINHDKSYSSGPFRESCGGDFYRGGDVTPFYVESFSTPAEVYVAMNKVIKWSVKFHVPMFKTLYFLRKHLDGQLFLVPEWEDPSSGLLTRWTSKRYRLLKRREHKKTRCVFTHTDLLCVLGGYATSTKNGFMEYTPRERPTYFVDNARLPKGYLDGRCVDNPHSETDSYSQAVIISLL